MVVLFGTAVYAAGGGFKVFERQYTVQIEPIEVIELTDPITTGLKPGEPIVVTYQIKNHDTQKHWNVVAQITIQGREGAGLQSNWWVEEENTSYALGTPLLIPSGYYRTLRATFFPTENMTINVRICRTTSTQGIG